MKTKILSLVLLNTIFLAILVNAAVTFTADTSTLTFTQAATSANFTLTNNGNETETITIPSEISVSDGTNKATVTLNKYLFSIENGTSETISASVNSAEIEKLAVGIYSTSINIVAKGTESNESSTQAVTIKVDRSYCEKGPLNLSLIEIRNVDESGSSSDNDWEWYPQDKITLSVKVKNKDNDNDRVVRVQWDIYDPNQKEFLDVGDDDTVDVSSEDDETLDFTFDVPYDLEQGNYILYVKAYDDDDGEDKICSVADEDGNSAAAGEEEGIPIKIKRDRNDVRIISTNIPDILSCGSTADIDLSVANLGRTKEDKIKVTLLDSVFSKETSREISKLDWSDKAERISFPIRVPESLQEKTYDLKFAIDFEYDKDDDEYNSHETVTYKLGVKGNCVAAQTNSAASITADLESEEAIAGQKLAIIGTLKNTGDNATTYSLSASGYSSWAALDSIEPTTITLDAGKSKDFHIYLDVKAATTGEQSFTINAAFNGETEEQDVSVDVTGAQTASITGSAVTEYLKANWFIWVIVIINIVLIIAIIIVARRIVASK